MHYLWMAFITFVIVQMSVFCTTIYLHRTRTHRGLELHPAVGFVTVSWLLEHIRITPLPERGRRGRP